MSSHTNQASIRRIINFVLTGLLVWLLYQPVPAAQALGTGAAKPQVDTTVYLPLVMKYYPWFNPLGVEAERLLQAQPGLLQRAADLHAGWLRINKRVSWRLMQPNEGDPIQWSVLAGFEQELRDLRDKHITPIVIIYDYPRWATDNTVRTDGQPTSCGPLRDDKINAYATFMQSLVARYKTSDFNVHIWELGNEPDVDPNLVVPDEVYGCWGKISDPTYGGQRYGEMLKIVSPAIKAVDPQAQVWLGGLLLATPLTTDPTRGHPELFLQGVLDSGAAPYFDVVPYHYYGQYWTEEIRDFDNDNAGYSNWDSWGGGTIGKARYLRDMMQRNGVNKPVFDNEVALGCPTWAVFCNPASPGFFDAQANFLVRVFARGMNEGIMGFTWYTLDGPGYRETGLLDMDGTPRPSYYAYLQFVTRIYGASSVAPVAYGAGIEAYQFQVREKQVQVIYATQNITTTITLPQAKFIAAYDRDGNTITPTVVGSDYQFSIGFQPIYIERRP